MTTFDKHQILPELKKIEELCFIKNPHWRHEIIDYIQFKDESYPIYSFVLGSEDKTAPTLGLFGGVHGLERIGTHVIIAFLNSILEQMEWDKDLQETMKNTRIVSIPLVNPAGMAHGYRSNGNGVDLMRNAPVESEESTSPLLLSGHRLSSKLPWFRGTPEIQMEKEALILCDFVEKEMFQSSGSIAVDFHSGFGMRDRFWYPFAKSKKTFPRIQEVRKIKDLLDKTLPHHIYKIEPQSKSYTTHGDLWDFLFLKFEEQLSAEPRDSLFLPWTLEMGSWIWLKKNPSQGLSLEGFFNPVKEHRLDRTMRRHLPLVHFLLHLVRNKHSWTIKQNL